MTRADTYRILARVYGYTPQQIAEMTYDQQYLLLSDTDDKQQTFSTYAEYKLWLTGTQHG